MEIDTRKPEENLFMDKYFITSIVTGRLTGTYVGRIILMKGR